MSPAVAKVARTTVAAALAGVGTVAASKLAQRKPSVRARLSRTNFRGEEVTLAEGPAIVAGLCATALVDPAAAVAALSAGSLGLVDDLTGTTDRRGFAGHLGALAHGEVTTGAVKIIGIGVTGLLVAGVIDRRCLRPDTLLAAGMIAGGANLINLFDLRPGRALKVSAFLATPLTLAGAPAAPIVLGAAAGAARDDLAGRSMMGDTGANALGAVLGVAAARRLGPRGRATGFAAVLALTLASEAVSFSKVIESSPVLRAIDQWGRPR